MPIEIVKIYQMKSKQNFATLNSHDLHKSQGIGYQLLGTDYKRRSHILSCMVYGSASILDQQKYSDRDMKQLWLESETVCSQWASRPSFDLSQANISR